MHNSQSIAERIKNTAKSKNISLKTMLSDCGLGINLISQLANGQAVTYVNIAKIADYLDCSVDYLLGRTTSNVTVSDVHDSVGVVGQANAPVTIQNGIDRQLTTQEKDLLRIYNNATSRQQLKLMNFALTMEEENDGKS